MIVRQIRLKMMDVFCYIVGDEASGTCALIDPAFETERILKTVRDENLTVSFVINTHSHADHCAGNAQILASTGARLLIHEDDAKGLSRMRNRVFARLLGGRPSPDADIALKDGNQINIGDTRLQVLHTPGHSPGSICLYGKGNLFTGDTLFTGSIGRTDLSGGSYKLLVKSVQEKILTLPEDTRIWPGHDYGAQPYSTVGAEKMTNPYVNMSQLVQ